MDVDVPEQSFTSRNEEAQVDATLAAATKDNSPEEAKSPPPPPVVEAEDVEMKQEPTPPPAEAEEPLVEEALPEDLGIEPQATFQVPLPDMPPRMLSGFSSSSLSEPEAEPELEPATFQPSVSMDEELEDEQEDEVGVEEEPPVAYSPPRRTLADAASGSPHYRHTSPIPSSIHGSPEFSALDLNPQETETNPAYDPLVTPYSLSLYPLPPGPKKQKKKTKGGGGLEAYRWQVTIGINPVSKWFRKATKCLSSKEWAVGFSERRFARAMQQVEQLKEKGKWSFRQPKRSKGPVLAKVHWDYLLDEMVRICIRFVLAFVDVLILLVALAPGRL